MTQTEMAHAIAVLQAAMNGKVIQTRTKSSEEWKDTPYPKFDFLNSEYRVRPNPRTIWLLDKAIPSLADEKPASQGYVKFVEVID